MRQHPAWIDGQIGKRFGSIVILARQRDESGGDRTALIRCDCGVEKLTDPGSIRNGQTKTCGKHRGGTRGMGRTHGMASSKEYGIWWQMIERCTEPTNVQFKNYGARGIKVCERWLTFENFFADMGPKPNGLTLDRENNDDDYRPGNCRWATPKQQSNNTRRNKFIEFNGRRLTVAQWADFLGMRPSTIWCRLKAGHSPALILNPKSIKGKRFDLIQSHEVAA